MGFLGSLAKIGGQVAQVAGAGFEGAGQDKAIALQQAIAQRQAQHQMSMDAITASLDKSRGALADARAGALTAPKSDVKTMHVMPNGQLVAEHTDGTFSLANMRGTETPPPAAGAGQGGPDAPPALPTAAPSPMAGGNFAAPKKLTPHAFMADGRPTEGFVDDQGKVYDQNHQPVAGKITPYVAPTAPSVISTPSGVVQVDRQGHATAVTDAKGNPVIKSAPGGGAMAAPIAAKVAQFGEMLKKAQDITGITDGLDVTVGQSATRDLAEHGVHIPLIGTVPGSKGLGSELMSRTPQYSQYQAALAPFILAAAHALSGARINQDQVEQIRKSIELAPGDFTNKDVRAQKEKNMIDLMNSIGGSLPKDAIGAQEGQMDESALSGLAARGYKRIGAPPAPTGAAHPLLAKYGVTPPPP